MKLPDGIYTREQLPREDYDRLARVNFSTLKHIALSPAHYHAALLTPSTDTDPKKLGRATHMATYEPDQFRSQCIVWEGKVRRGGEWDAFVDRHPDAEIVTPAMHETALAVGNAVRTHPVARKYVTGGRGELTILWTYKVPAAGGLPGFSVECKSRIDFEAEVGALVDLKSTQNASPSAFGRTAANLNYHVQAAFYRRGYFEVTGKLLPYFLVAAETKTPHVVQPYRVTEDLLDLGEERFTEWLALYNVCRQHSSWPGYAETELDLTFPRWALPFEEDGIEDLGIDIGGANVAPAISF